MVWIEKVLEFPDSMLIKNETEPPHVFGVDYLFVNGLDFEIIELRVFEGFQFEPLLRKG
jgi:hypothetical protein